MNKFSNFQLDEFDKKFYEISSLHRAVEEYNIRGGTNRLEKIRQELAELNIAKEENTRDRERIDKEIQSIKELLQGEEVN